VKIVGRWGSRSSGRGREDPEAEAEDARPGDDFKIAERAGYWHRRNGRQAPLR
jgi:hypothetical protein